MIRNGFQRFVGLFAGTLLCAAASLVIVAETPGTVWAQSKPSAPASGAAFGSVDVDQVIAESNSRKKDIAARNDFIKNLNTVMQRLQTGSARLLNETEMKELSDLYEKPQTTDAEKKRIGALESQAEQRSLQLLKLQNTANLDDTQRKQLQDLTEAQQRGDASLKTTAEAMRDRLDQRDQASIAKILAEIKTVVSKVAQEKGLAVIFDSKVAVYTANDVTADVIKQVNK